MNCPSCGVEFVRIETKPAKVDPPKKVVILCGDCGDGFWREGENLTLMTPQEIRGVGGFFFFRHVATKASAG